MNADGEHRRRGDERQYRESDQCPTELLRWESDGPTSELGHVLTLLARLSRASAKAMSVEVNKLFIATTTCLAAVEMHLKLGTDLARQQAPVEATETTSHLPADSLAALRHELHTRANQLLARAVRPLSCCHR